MHNMHRMPDHEAVNAVPDGCGRDGRLLRRGPTRLSLELPLPLPSGTVASLQKSCTV